MSEQYSQDDPVITEFAKKYSKDLILEVVNSDSMSNSSSPVDYAIFVFPVPLFSPIESFHLGTILGRAKYVYRCGTTPAPRFFGIHDEIPLEVDLFEWLDREVPRYLEYERKRHHKRTILSAGYGLSRYGLIRSISEANAAILRSFLALGFSPDTVNEDHIPILHLAIRSRNEETSAVIIESGADPNRRSSDRGNTAVAEAAAMRSPRIIKKLMDAGGDPNSVTADGQTPLMIAIGDGDVEIVEALLAAGASLDVTDKLGMTPVKYARLFKKERILELLDAYSTD